MSSPSSASATGSRWAWQRGRSCCGPRPAPRRLAHTGAGVLRDECDHRSAPGRGLVPRIMAAFFKMSFSSLEVGVLAAQAAQLVRFGQLASGSAASALTELRRLGVLAHPRVKDPFADPKSLAATSDYGLAQGSTRSNGLGFELGGISSSGHGGHRLLISLSRGPES